MSSSLLVVVRDLTPPLLFSGWGSTEKTRGEEIWGSSRGVLAVSMSGGVLLSLMVEAQAPKRDGKVLYRRARIHYHGVARNL